MLADYEVGKARQSRFHLLVGKYAMNDQEAGFPIERHVLIGEFIDAGYPGGAVVVAVELLSIGIAYILVEL